MRAWTESYLQWIKTKVRFDQRCQQVSLEDYLNEVDHAGARIARLEKAIDEAVEQAPETMRELIRALQALRGVAKVGAVTIVAEVGTLSRFEHPRQLMAYLGLVPGEDSSGPRRRQGAITKCGNSHARWMLVECAHHYDKAPKVSVPLSKRQEGQSKEVKELSWRAQNRLHSRFGRLAMRQLHRNKVVVAVARELCGFIWELMRLVSAKTEENAALASGARRSKKSTKGRTYMLKRS
jgi:transposase